MSDYFTRLAERAIGVAEAIKPRVPYRFEHGAYVVPTMPPAEQDEERSAEVAEVDAPSKRSAEGPPRPRVPDRSMFVPHRVEEPSRDVSRSTQQPIPATKASNVPGEPQPMGVEPAPVTAPQTARVLEPKPQAETSPSRPANAAWDIPQDAATKVQATIDRRTEDAHVVRGGTETRPARASTLTETPNRAAPQPAPGPAQVKQPPSSTSEIQGPSRASFDLTPLVLRPRRKDEHELSRAMTVSSSERRAEPPHEPTIKVTIGRVEVRAVMEPTKPPSRPRKPASSAISLDEFLKRHEERRR